MRAEMESTLGTPDALSSITQLNSDGTMMMLDPASRFYNDLPEAEQKQWVAELRAQPVSAQLMRITYATHQHVSATYLLCSRDEGLPPALQRGMLDAAVAAGARFSIETFDTGHSVFLSQPDVLVRLVKQVVDKP